MNNRKKQNAFYRFARIFIDNNIFPASAEMSYYLLFAFFPLLMVVFASFSLAGDVFSDMTFKFHLLPESVEELIDVFIEHVGSTKSNLSYLIFGIFLMLYSVSRFTKGAKSKVRILYGSKTLPNPFAEWIVSLIFSLLLLVVFYVTLFVLIMGKQVLVFISGFIPISAFVYKLIMILRYLLTGFVVFFVLFLFYYFIPNVRQKPMHIIPGTVFALLSWIVVSVGFTFYINNIANYSLVYGSIGAFIILLLWFYITSLLLLTGSIINSMVYKSYILKLQKQNAERNSGRESEL